MPAKPKRNRAIYNDLLQDAIAKHVDPVKLVKGLYAMATEATRPGAVAKDGTAATEVPDHDTRIKAAKLLLEYGVGKPLQRAMLVDPSDGQEETRMLDAQQAEQHREAFYQWLRRREAGQLAEMPAISV